MATLPRLVAIGRLPGHDLTVEAIRSVRAGPAWSRATACPSRSSALAARAPARSRLTGTLSPTRSTVGHRLRAAGDHAHPDARAARRRSPFRSARRARDRRCSRSARTDPTADRRLVLGEVAADHGQVEGPQDRSPAARARGGTRTSARRGPSDRPRHRREAREVGRAHADVVLGDALVAGPEPSRSTSSLGGRRRRTRPRPPTSRPRLRLAGRAPVGRPRDRGVLRRRADERPAARARPARPAVDATSVSGPVAVATLVAEEPPRAVATRRSSVASSTSRDAASTGRPARANSVSFRQMLPIPASARWSSSASEIVSPARAGSRSRRRASAASPVPVGREQVRPEPRERRVDRLGPRLEQLDHRRVEADRDRARHLEHEHAPGPAGGASARRAGSGATSRSSGGGSAARGRCRTGSGGSCPPPRPPVTVEPDDPLDLRAAGPRPGPRSPSRPTRYGREPAAVRWSVSPSGIRASASGPAGRREPARPRSSARTAAGQPAIAGRSRPRAALAERRPGDRARRRPS